MHYQLFSQNTDYGSCKHLVVNNCSQAKSPQFMSHNFRFHTFFPTVSRTVFVKMKCKTEPALHLIHWQDLQVATQLR